jgi:hypothetical protein
VDAGSPREMQAQAPKCRRRLNRGQQRRPQVGRAEASVWTEGMSAALVTAFTKVQAFVAEHGLFTLVAAHAGEPISMQTPPPGELYAGEPLVQFGGRGGPWPFPTPIDLPLFQSFPNRSLTRLREKPSRRQKTRSPPSRGRLIRSSLAMSAAPACAGLDLELALAARLVP